MKQLKVMTILGTRPEIVRLSRVMAQLDAHLDHCMVHTGQNYDRDLKDIFFRDLGIRQPDHYLDADTTSLGSTLGSILSKTETVLDTERPDAVLVLGDTNSSISALMARRMQVPVYHMEAGNRSFDANVPEEVNRKVVDHIADFNLVYTEHARRHLLSEGLPHRRIYKTGSPMREVLRHYDKKIAASDIVQRLDLSPRQFFVASLHREENVDCPKRLLTLCKTLNLIVETYGFPIVFSVHPRTRKQLDKLPELTLRKEILQMSPLGFLDYNKLQLEAFCVISDSGTIAEEAALLGFPAVTPRDAIERPEALDAGTIVMTGLNTATLLQAIKVVTARFDARQTHREPVPVPSDYMIENTSERVLNLILGTARLSHQWDGVREIQRG